MDTTSPTSVLLATTNEVLLDDLLRLAAAASITPLVEPDLFGLRRSWYSCSLVVVGRDLAEPLTGFQPPHRSGVVVVGSARDGDDLIAVLGAAGTIGDSSTPPAKRWRTARSGR